MKKEEEENTQRGWRIKIAHCRVSFVELLVVVLDSQNKMIMTKEISRKTGWQKRNTTETERKGKNQLYSSLVKKRPFLFGIRERKQGGWMMIFFFSQENNDSSSVSRGNYRHWLRMTASAFMRALVSSNNCCHPIVCTDGVKFTDKRKEKVLSDWCLPNRGH